MLGGTQSLHTNSYDEAIALPTEKAARLALRTQQVIAHETDVAHTVDPFAGSYVVESMTDEIEAEILRLIDEVNSRGGAVAAVETGFQKSRIEDSAFRVASQIDRGERVVVGVNRYVLDEPEHYEPLRINPDVERRQKEKLVRLRESRDGNAVAKALAALREAAATDINVVPLIKQALAVNATVGEVSDSLRDVWGTFHAAEFL